MPFSPISAAAPSSDDARNARTRLVRGALWTTLSLIGITAVKLIWFDYLGPVVPFLLYFVSILTGAWFDGWRGGLLASAASALLGTYFFLPPYNTFSLLDDATVVRLVAFLVEGVAITALAARLTAERRRADLAARSAERSVAELEGVMRGVSDGITVQTARGGLIYANEAAARLSGFESARAMLEAPPAEILEHFELLEPDGSPLDVSQLPGRLALQGKPAPARLVRFRVRATGEERFSLIRANAVHIGQSEPVAVNVFHDVTEQRHQEEALRLSQEWLSTTLQSIGDAVIATDEKGCVSFMNALAEKLTGWSASDAKGHPLSEAFVIVNQDTREPVESPVDRVLREGEIVGLANHTILIARDGSEIAIDDSAAPIRAPNDELVGTVLIFRDVSERRAEERRRSFAARATAELATSLDYESTLATIVRLAVPTIADWCAIDMYVNGTLERLAVQHVDPAKVELVYEIERLYPTDPEEGRGAYHVARTGEPVFVERIPDELLVQAAKDDEHLRLIRQLQLRSYIAVPIATNEGVLAVLTLAMAESGRTYDRRDLDLAITLADRAALAINHARLFEQATSARTEAERASRAKDEFLAMLGHELRNPLAPMLTALQLMRMRAPDAVERERQILERQLKHVVTLVDDLLDVSRITRGKIELTKEPVDLSDTLAKALELTLPLLEERRHEVIVDVPKSTLVSGDPVRLAQVLSNLISNAAKYTEPGGRLEIRGRRDGDSVTLEVKDNGQGIHPDLLPHVFDLFVQDRQSLDRAQGGLGLGLAIVRNVVELHAGRVSAESAGPGRGSTFRVELPALDAGVLPAPPAAERARDTPAPGLRVLVVDDNADARDLLGEALNLFGYDVHTTGDPATALARARDLKPAIALLDIGLPVMDGYELARRMRAIEGLEQIKLVAITGYGQPADKRLAHEAGFDEHLVKPVALEALRSVLEHLAGES